MSIGAIVERLERLDPSTLDVGAVAAGLRDLSRLKGFVATLELALARRADELAANGSGAPADELLGAATHCSRHEASKTARRAEALGDLPAVSAQLGAGRIGTEHADILAAATRRLDHDDRDTLLSLDTELARTAAASTPAQFRRHVERLCDQLTADRGLERAERQRNATTLAKGIDDHTGMYWLRAELHPDEPVATARTRRDPHPRRPHHTHRRIAPRLGLRTRRPHPTPRGHHATVGLRRPHHPRRARR
jgi:hypothetical protein